MTNHTLPDRGAALSRELLALAPVGGKRRPVKVVEHPAFRTAHEQLNAPFTVLRLPVVALNGQTRPAAYGFTSLLSTIEAA
jgi:hypothetical protein